MAYKRTGNFKDGTMDGHGVLSFPSGTRYVGHFRDGHQEGRGQMLFQPSGDYCTCFLYFYVPVHAVYFSSAWPMHE